MTNYRLYTVSVTERSLTRGSKQRGREVSDLGALANGSTSVTPLGLSAGEQTQRAQYGGYNDHVLGEMLSELAQAPDIDSVPYYGVQPDGGLERTPENGYYSVSRAAGSNPDPRRSDFPTEELTMKRLGTRSSHWRRLASKPTLVENQFGNGTAEEVAVPAAAEKVQWWDGDISTEVASPASTVATEFGDADVYLASDSPYSSADLIYELPYTEEGRTDTAVWDDRGHGDKTSSLDDERVLEWQKVFHRDHEFEGSVVLSNGRARLTVDEPSGSVSAESWSSGSWSPVSLSPNGWEVLDLDLTRVGCALVEAVVVFVDTADGSTYRLDMALARGADWPVWYVPENLVDAQGGVPSGLESWLDPVASDRLVMMNPDQGLVKRSEVRG